MRQTAGMRITVLVEHWQMECCGDPFGIGAPIAWQLVFEPCDPAQDRTEDLAVDIAPIAWRTLTDGARAFECATIGPGIEVAIRQEAVHKHGRTRGTLVEEHHGGAPESLPATHATVRRIQLAVKEFRLTDGGFRAVPGTVRLREVAEVPAAFRDKPVTDQARMIEIGVLCDIEAGGAP